MILRIWKFGADVKWAKSGEWTVAKCPRNINIQYGLWIWAGPVRQDGVSAFGFALGPVKVIFGVLHRCPTPPAPPSAPAG